MRRRNLPTSSSPTASEILWQQLPALAPAGDSRIAAPEIRGIGAASGAVGELFRSDFIVTVAVQFADF